jgi:hypothetical protein
MPKKSNAGAVIEVSEVACLRERREWLAHVK